MNSYARKKRQLLFKLKTRKTEFLKGSERLDFEKNTWIKTVKADLRKLAKITTQWEWKKVAAGLAIVAGLSFGNQAQAQKFADPVKNPFGLDSVDNIALPTFVDLDDDGDFDLMVGEEYGYFKYFENIGTPTDPDYADSLVNPFGLDTGSYFVMPNFIDLDDDGDLDLMAIDDNKFFYRENIGSSTLPEFGVMQVDPFGIAPGTEYIFGTMADLDDDGDYDIFYTKEMAMYFVENTGSVTSPAFGTPELSPFGLDTGLVYFGTPEFVDFDKDGDLDMFMSEYEGNIIYFENIGSASEAEFDEMKKNPFGLTKVIGYGFPTIADLDDDGDLDLLVGDYGGQFVYYENVTPVSVENDMQNSSLTIFPNPVNDVLNISSLDKIERIEIYNILGEKVMEIANPNNQIDVSELMKGTYVAILTDAIETQSKQRIVKN